MDLSYVEVKSGTHVLRGMKHNSSKQKYAFLIVHGYFSSNKIGPHRLYVEIANHLCERYGDVYRFDLSGMGESDGRIEKIRLSTHVGDVEKIIEYIKGASHLPLIVIAHCMGCNLLLEILKIKQHIFREIIFLAPYFTNEEILRLFFKRSGQIEDLYKEGYTFRNGLYADRSFFLENTFYENFINSINSNATYINIIAAGNDQFIPRTCNDKLLHDGKNINHIYIEQTDHNFLEHRQSLLDAIGEMIEDGKYSE